MATKKVTELETVTTQTVPVLKSVQGAINDFVEDVLGAEDMLASDTDEQSSPIAPIAQRDYANELALSIQQVILTVKDKIATERPPIKGIRPYAQELMVSGVGKLPLNNPLLTRFFANSVKRMSDVNNTALGNIETTSGYDAALASFLVSIDWFSRGWDSEGQYEKSIKSPTVATSGSRGSTVYKTLAARITLMSQSVDVELSHRKHYQKVSDNLLKSGKPAYDAMLAIPTAALIIRNAEAAIAADVSAAPAIDLDFS
jgi:hypothetical protein